MLSLCCLHLMWLVLHLYVIVLFLETALLAKNNCSLLYAAQPSERKPTATTCGYVISRGVFMDPCREYISSILTRDRKSREQQAQQCLIFRDFLFSLDSVNRARVGLIEEWTISQPNLQPVKAILRWLWSPSNFDSLSDTQQWLGERASSKLFLAWFN